MGFRSGGFQEYLPCLWVSSRVVGFYSSFHYPVGRGLGGRVRSKEIKNKRKPACNRENKMNKKSIS